MTNTQNKTKYFIGMLVAMLFWGFAWTSGKATAEHSNAQIAAFWRYAISFLSIIPVIWYMKIPLRADRIALIYMLLAGLLISLFNYLFFAGLFHGQAGYGGTMVTSISPIFTYILSIVFLKIEVTNRQIMALFIGIFGAFILLKIPFEGLGFLNIESSYFFSMCHSLVNCNNICTKSWEKGC